MTKKIIAMVLLIFQTSISYAEIVQIKGDVVSDSTNIITQTSTSINDEILPNWVLEAQGNGRYIGISDPALEKSKAFNQALLRAWMLSQIDAQFKIEDKTIIREKGREAEFESNSILSSLLLSNITLYIGREYISSYGEYFVEFFTEPTNDDRIYELSINKDCKGFVFTQYMQNNNSESSVSINGVIDFPGYNNEYYSKEDTYNINNLNTTQFKYKSTLPDSPKPKTGKRNLIQNVMSSDGTEILCSSSLNEGYWYAFISSLLDYAASLSREQESEFLNTANWIDDILYESLSEKSNNKMRMSLSATHIKENKLYIEWNADIIE